MFRTIASDLAASLRVLINTTGPKACDLDEASRSRHVEALNAYDVAVSSHPLPQFDGIRVRTIHQNSRKFATIDHATGTMDVEIHKDLSTREALLSQAEAIRADVERRLRRATLMQQAAEALPAE